MKGQKNILLTFDFELFLGSKSGSVDHCMMQPTLDLLSILELNGLSSIFFVDTLYLSRLKELVGNHDKAAKDFEKIIQLLRRIIKSGGYVFHHIHPHWLDAIYLNEVNQWDVGNKSRFALSNLSAMEVETVFSTSSQIIDEVYEGLKKPPHFGFRAGGLYAQPFSIYKQQMLRYNILYDFSVLKGASSVGENGAFTYDYTNYPAEDIYAFSNDLLKKDEEGSFVELAMTQLKLEGLHKILNGIHYRFNVNKPTWKRMGDGSSSGNLVKGSSKSNRLSTTETFSIESLNSYKVKLYRNHIRKHSFIQIISHPKLLSPNNIQVFANLVSDMVAKYKVETDLFLILENNASPTKV